MVEISRAVEAITADLRQIVTLIETHKAHEVDPLPRRLGDQPKATTRPES